MKSKLVLFNAYLTLTFITSITSTQIDCFYKTYHYTALDLTYQCIVNNNPDITDYKSSVIESVDGAHDERKFNNDVAGFFADQKTIQIFPNNLEKFFKNLKALWIINCGLKEIFQTDLRKFPMLVYIQLPENKIEVIEEGLFAFNPYLRVIGFSDNNLIHVDPNVFDKLTILNHFWFTNSSCVHFRADSENQAKVGIRRVKNQCVSSKVTAMEREYENLKADSMKVEAFVAKVKNFGKKLMSSKFGQFRPLRNNFESLGDYSSCGRMSNLVKPTRTNYNPTTANPYQNSESSTRNYDYDFYRNYQPYVSSYKPHNVQEFRSREYAYTLENQYNLQTNQCESINDLKLSQYSIQSFLVTLVTSQNDHKLAINKLDLNLTTKLNHIQINLENLQKTFQDSLQITYNRIGDIETTLTDLTASQSEVKDTLLNLKNSQDEIEDALSNINNVEDVNENILNLEEKLEGLAVKMVKIEDKISNFGHKIEISVDEKMKESEKRIVKKMEEMMRKILNEEQH